MTDIIAGYFSYPFVRYAFIVGVLTAFCSALLGVTLVLKRFSFLGDGLSHFAFGILAIATVAGFGGGSMMIVVLPVTVICAVLLLRTGQNAKIKGDAALAVMSVSSLAIGYLLLNVFSVSSNVSGDVCNTLFGSSSMLTLKKSDVILCAVTAAAVTFFYVICYNKIFAVTFDEDFASATGIRSGVYNTAIAVVSAVVIVLGMKLVGSLLVTALIVFPALSAMRIFKSFRAVVIFSAVLSVVSASVGFMLSLVFSTPVGATMVAADIAAFLVCCAAGKITG